MTRVRARTTLGIVALKLQIGLQRLDERLPPVTSKLDFIHHLDGVLTHEYQQFVDLFGINELVRQASIELFVANPSTANALLHEQAQNGRNEVK